MKRTLAFLFLLLFFTLFVLPCPFIPLCSQSHSHTQRAQHILPRFEIDLLALFLSAEDLCWCWLLM